MLWTGQELVDGSRPEAEPVVVDSWLLSDGGVVGLEDHERRFRRACSYRFPQLAADELTCFLAAVRERSPASGSWFPRIEAWDTGLAVQFRLAPKRRETTELWVPSVPDPRSVPTVKGPDLPALTGLREEAQQAGADDAVLCTSEGYVVESAHSAVLWWRDDALCVPTPVLPALESVTVSAVLNVAVEHGVRIRRDRLSLDEVGTLAVWTANTLHGVSPVTKWRFWNGKTIVGPSASADEWNYQLDKAAHPVRKPSSPSDAR